MTLPFVQKCNKLGDVLPAAAGTFYLAENKRYLYLATCKKLGESLPVAGATFFASEDDPVTF